MRDDSGVAARRAVLIGVVVLGVVAVFLVSVIALLVLDHGTCSGDGGSPYSAEDSVAGDFCDGPLRGVWQVALAFGPAVLAAGLGVLAVVRTRVALLAIALAAGALAVFALAVPVAALPNTCSDADQRAYDRWVENDRAGPRPADCETY
jgi:hypothetical protein